MKSQERRAMAGKVRQLVLCHFLAGVQVGRQWNFGREFAEFNLLTGWNGGARNL